MSNPPQSSRKEWAAVTRLEAFRKWRPQATILARGVTDAIVEAAQVKPAMRVLDLASGAGEPAMALCTAVGSEGHVTATDLEPQLLALAREFALERGVQNIALTPANAESLPFADRKFDRVTCRFGVMYFPNPTRALREAYRVLKPRGRAVFSVWTSPEQPFFASTVGVLRKHAQAPHGGQNEPDPFRFATPGSLSVLLRDAGFRSIQEETQDVSLTWAGTPEQFWQYFQEHTAPFRALIDGLAPEHRSRVTAEVCAALGQYSDGRQIKLPAVILLASGLR